MPIGAARGFYATYRRTPPGDRDDLANVIAGCAVLLATPVGFNWQEAGFSSAVTW